MAGIEFLNPFLISRECVSGLVKGLKIKRSHLFQSDVAAFGGIENLAPENIPELGGEGMALTVACIPDITEFALKCLDIDRMSLQVQML